MYFSVFFVVTWICLVVFLGFREGLEMAAWAWVTYVATVISFVLIYKIRSALCPPNVRAEMPRLTWNTLPEVLYCEKCNAERHLIKHYCCDKVTRDSQKIVVFTGAEDFSSGHTLASMRFPAQLGDIMLKYAFNIMLGYVDGETLSRVQSKSALAAYAKETLRFSYDTDRQLAEACEAYFSLDMANVVEYLETLGLRPTGKEYVFRL